MNQILDKFSIIDNEIVKRKIPKRLNHLSSPSKLSCFSFDLPLSVCQNRCLYFKKGICYSKNNNLHESYPSRKKLLKRNLKLAKSDQFVKILTEQIRFKKQRLFRFFSKGDFMDFKNLKNIVEICKNLPSVVFWIPTSRDDLLIEYFEKQKLKIPTNCIIKLSCPIPLSDMPKFLKDFCKKYNISYSCTSLNKKIVNCPSSLGKNGSQCLDCELCFSDKFNPVYLIHNPISISNSKKLVEKRIKDLK